MNNYIILKPFVDISDNLCRISDWLSEGLKSGITGTDEEEAIPKEFTIK